MSSFANKERSDGGHRRRKNNAADRALLLAARGEDGDGADLVRLRERFERHLPRYGVLWRSMANAREASGTKDGSASRIGGNDAPARRAAGGKENAPSSQPPNLLDAILNKRQVSLRAPTDNHAGLCGDGCDCADPIVEIDDDDEDASAYDVDLDEELADTDDERADDSEGRASGEQSGRGWNDHDGSAAEGIRLDESNVCADDNDEASFGDDDSDDEIIIVSKTPKKKKKMVILDDEDDEETGIDDGAGGFGDEDAADADECFELERSDGGSEEYSGEKLVTLSNDDEDNDTPAKKDDGGSDYSSSEKPLPRRRGINSKAKDAVPPTDFSVDSDDEEEAEWIELSSDDEEEDLATPPKRVNTVIILSDEEIDSEDDSSEDGGDHSSFAVSIESDEDSSSDDDTRAPVSGGRKTRKAKTTLTSRTAVPRKKGGASDKGAARNRHQKAPDRQLAFKRNRAALTAHTFSEFNSRVFSSALSSVEVVWSNKLNKTAGVTRMRGKLGEQNRHTRVATIELATKVLDDEEKLRSTLLHEMCHAAQWLVDGVHKPPHGKVFKKWAAISMRKVKDVEVTTTHDYQIAYKFAWACTSTNCNVVIKRHSRSVDPTKQCCGACKGRLVEIEVPGSKGDTAKLGYTPKKERKASDFALFVRDQSAEVRRSLARDRSCTPKEISQSDVMKECGNRWRSRKAASLQNSAEDGLENVADRLVNMTLEN